MTQDKIIALAREAGMEFVTTNSYSTRNKDVTHLYQNMYGIEKMERFAALVAAHERERIMNEPLTKAMWERFESEVRTAEREACAKVCESMYNSPTFSDEYIECADAIRAIRARGDK